MSDHVSRQEGLSDLRCLHKPLARATLHHRAGSGVVPDCSAPFPPLRLGFGVVADDIHPGRPPPLSATLGHPHFGSGGSYDRLLPLSPRFGFLPGASVLPAAPTPLLCAARICACTYAVPARQSRKSKPFSSLKSQAPTGDAVPFYTEDRNQFGGTTGRPMTTATCEIARQLAAWRHRCRVASSVHCLCESITCEGKCVRVVCVRAKQGSLRHQCRRP